MTDVLTQFNNTIQSLTLVLNQVKMDYKNLEKHVLKEARMMDKANAAETKQRISF